MTSVLQREEEQVRELFGYVDAVVDVARAIERDRPQEAARLLGASRSALSHAAPVRVTIAARLLLVSDKTVRAWVADGLLTQREQRPRLLLDPARLHDVLEFLRDLRAAGRDRDLRESIWHRLQDDALLDREDLAESLAQMRAGQVAPALTAAEEDALGR